MLENLASSRRGMRTALLLGLLLALPSLGVGFFADDWIQRLGLSGSVPDYAPEPWNLYEWRAADPVLPSPLMDAGVLSWTSHEQLRAHFFRPLSSLLLALDALLLRHGRGGPRTYADPRQALPRRVPILVAALAVAHLGVSPVVRLARPAVYALASETSTRLIDDAEISCSEGADVVLLPPVEPFPGGYSPALALGSPSMSPRTWRVLSMAPFDHVMARTSESAFELRVVGGAMLTTPMEQLGRPPTAPLLAGDQIELSRMRIRVLEVSDHGPIRVLFDLGRPLEDPGLCFVERHGDALREARIPELGDERILSYRRFMQPRTFTASPHPAANLHE